MTMTKAEELKKLDEFIAVLGKATYLGPWLADNRAAIERDMRSDIPPMVVLPGDAYRAAEQILLNANVEAGQIRAAAEQRATDLIDATELRISDAKTRAKRALRDLADRL